MIPDWLAIGLTMVNVRCHARYEDLYMGHAQQFGRVGSIAMEWIGREGEDEVCGRDSSVKFVSPFRLVWFPLWRFGYLVISTNMGLFYSFHIFITYHWLGRKRYH